MAATPVGASFTVDQVTAIRVLADGPADTWKNTDARHRLVSRKIARQLAKRGFVEIDVGGRATLTDKGREALARDDGT